MLGQLDPREIATMQPETPEYHQHGLASPLVPRKKEKEKGEKPDRWAYAKGLRCPSAFCPVAFPP